MRGVQKCRKVLWQGTKQRSCGEVTPTEVLQRPIVDVEIIENEFS